MTSTHKKLIRLIATALCVAVVLSQAIMAQAAYAETEDAQSLPVQTEMAVLDEMPSEEDALPEEGEIPPEAGDLPLGESEIPPEEGEIPPEAGDLPPGEGDTLPAEVETELASAPNEAADWLVRLWDFFWRAFGLFSFRVKPEENYAYNTKYAFQWLFGFNKAYDALSPVAGCLYDTIRCNFSYEGRDYLVQLWKGGYLFGLCTGGEIGYYSKDSCFPVEHYQGATMGDWIGMEFSIYYRYDDNKLFTRPMEDTWWATGYEFHLLEEPLDNPRTSCIMDATLRFKNADMAALFAASLAEKGFVTGGGLPFDVEHTEHYVLDGDTVRLMWKALNEGFI